MENKKRYVAPELSDAELAKVLKAIGKAAKEQREAVSTLDDFSYETGVSRSSLVRLESGRNVEVSTFLKVLYGLRKKPEDFFKEL